MSKPQKAPLKFDMKKPVSIAEPAAESKPVAAEKEAAGKGKGKSRSGRQFAGVHVMPEVIKQLKLLGIQKDATTQDLLVEALNDLFAKYGMSRIAD